MQSDGLSKHSTETARGDLIYTHPLTDEGIIGWPASPKLR